MNVPYRFLAITLSFFLSIIALTGCGESTLPDGYLSISKTEVSYVQFTEKDNRVTGNFLTAEVVGDPVSQVKSNTAAFTGVRNDSSITLTFSVAVFLNLSISGTLNGDVLTLNIPQSDGSLVSKPFSGASVQEYNRAINALQKNVNQENDQYYRAQATAVALQASQQAVDDASLQLNAAIVKLEHDQHVLTLFSASDTLARYYSDLQTMQSDYTIEQQAATGGCTHFIETQTDAIQVTQNDYLQIVTDSNELVSDRDQYKTDVSAVQDDINAVQQASDDYQNAVVNNPSATSSASYPLSSITQMIFTAKGTLTKSDNAWQRERSTGNSYGQQANHLKQQASTLLVNMHCTL